MKARVAILSLLILQVAACGDDAAAELAASGGQAQRDTTAQPASSRALVASQRPGMGATLYQGGVMFRVWAPNAARVWVTGDFNGWNQRANELGNEFNGNFSADVDGATRWQKYKYVIETRSGATLERADPRSARVENSSGASIIHDPGAYAWQSGFEMPWRNDLVIYELHVGTFHDAPGGGPGNWRSATDRLEHVQSLGVNLLQVMPVMEFAGDFSWGYNPAFPFAPESAYGSPEEMKQFVDAAHGRGLGVSFDVVVNHWGPSDLAMWCFDGDCLGNGGVYFYSDWRSYTPWGATRPDYGRVEVRSYIRDAAMMLLHEYRADGLRIDGTKWIYGTDSGGSVPEGYNLLQNLNNEVDSTQPWKVMIAEDHTGAHVTRSSSAGGLGFDMQWDASFSHRVRAALEASSDAGRSLYEVAGAVTANYNGNALERVIYLESHDETANGKKRLAESIWPGKADSWASKKRSTLGAAILMTSPGVPMVFQGQEMLEDGWFAAEDPVDWERSKWFGGIIDLYRTLIHFRRNWDNNTRGLRGSNVNVFHLNDADKLLAYHRWDNGGPGDDVVVVANFSSYPRYDYIIGLPRCGTWYPRVNTDWAGYSGDFNNTPAYPTEAWGEGRDGLPCAARVTVGPYSAVILSQ